MRLEGHGGRVAAPRPPPGASFQELGPSERHDEYRLRARPIEEVLDEVEGAAVRPVNVLEHEDRRAALRDSLEEGSPRREEGLALCSLGVHAEQGKEGRADPFALDRVADEVLDGRGDARDGRLGIVGLRQACALADHLAEGPEGNPLTVRRRTAGVPPHILRDPIGVDAELLDEPALSTSRGPDD